MKSAGKQRSAAMIIGVTGSLGTGKTTVSRMFGRLGAKIIDADRLVHSLLRGDAVLIGALAAGFGKDIRKPDGAVDRRRLARKAFAGRRQVARLNRIVHPAVMKKIAEKAGRITRRDPEAVVVVDAPLLFEAGAEKAFDRIVVVKADPDRQRERAARKAGLSAAEFRRRQRWQLPLAEKIRRADYVVDNNGTRGRTRSRVEEIWREIGGGA